jgi:hypothetical protein
MTNTPEAMLDDELFLMVNLYPRTTGLMMTVWAGPGDGSHAPRIKVNMAHGERMNMANTAVVAIQPQPHLIAGHLTTQDLAMVSAWIDLNREALLAHWRGEIDGAEMAARAQRI